MLGWLGDKTAAVNVQLPALPEGYAYTGEYRPAKEGELFLTSMRSVRRAGGTPGGGMKLIVKDLKPSRSRKYVLCPCCKRRVEEHEVQACKGCAR